MSGQSEKRMGRKDGAKWEDRHLWQGEYAGTSGRGRLGDQGLSFAISVPGAWARQV